MDAGLRMDSGAPSSTPRKMSKITRNWTKMAISPRIAYMRQAVDKQKATPSPIPHPYSDLTALDTLVAAAETVDAQIATLQTQIDSLRASRATKTDAAAAEFELDAKHVESDTKGDASQEIAAGFAVSAPASPSPAIVQPVELSVTMGSNDGSLDWHSHPVPGAVGMEPSTTANPLDATTWVAHTVVTQSSGTITGLPSGTRQYVRIRAIGPNGPGPWSDSADKMVP
jgi:uncharacterized small protein (DUF1192 family)